MSGLGVTSASVAHLEASFAKHATQALKHHEQQRINSRLKEVREKIGYLEERAGRARNIEKLINQLDELREEERFLSEDIRNEEQEELPMLSDLPPAKPRLFHDQVETEAIVSDAEDSLIGEEEHVDDDYQTDEYQNRLRVYCEGTHGFDELLQGKFSCIDTVPLIDKLNIPKDVFERLLDYQREGTKWLARLHLEKQGALLADEMGLGKTAQSVALITALLVSERLSNCLVIVPTTLLRQWIRELRSWFAPLRVVLLHPTGRMGSITKGSLRKALSIPAHVFVTSYGILQMLPELFQSKKFTIVILDEGHKIRNPEIQLTVACKKLRSDTRLLLSGTPLQNNLVELWSLMDFAEPGLLGKLATFRTEFVMPINAGAYAHASHFAIQLAYKCAIALKKLVEPHMLRRTKAEVAKQLPPKEEQILFCRLTESQLSMYKSCLNSEEVKSILEGDRNVLAGIDLLRKICNHPSLFDHSSHNLSVSEHCRVACKLAVIQSLLQGWSAQSHRCLIFCQTRQMLDIVENFIQKLEYSYLRMDGMTAASSRSYLVSRFNSDSSVFIFLLTTRVGGLGINLTGASRVIIIDPDWNPSTDLQARERVWRLGQRHAVQIYRLVTVGTIEEKIYHRQIFKQFLTNRILVDARQSVFLKATDLYDLFTLGEQEHLETEDLFAGLEEEICTKLGDNLLDTVVGAVEGLQAAIRHDKIVERSQPERVLVEAESEKLAQKAISNLKSNIHSNSLEQRLFRTFRANDGQLTSEQVVETFGKEVERTDSSLLFRAMLRKLAIFNSKNKTWQLRKEYTEI